MGKGKRREVIAGGYRESSYLIYGLLVLLFYPPYFRGLIFNQELLITHLLTFALLIAVLYLKPRNESFEIVSLPIDYVAVAFLLVYIVAGLFAVVPREALKEALKILNYLAVFYMVSFYAKKHENVQRLLYTLYLSGLGVALIGIFSAFGVIQFTDAIAEGRIFSTLQYPNTLASYLLGILIIGVYLSSREQEVMKAVAINTGNYLLFLTFLATQSRGALVFLPISLIILLMGPLGNRRKAILGYLSQSVIIALLVFPGSLAEITGDIVFSKILWLTVGIVAVGITTYLAYKLPSRFTGTSVNSKTVVGVVLLFLIVAVVFGATTQGSKVSTAFTRVKQISAEERNVQERFVFYKDGLKVAQDSLLLGSGGGGWSGVYKKYQTYNYSAREIHNGFLQVLIEVGIIGFIIWISIWICFFLNIIRNLANRQGDEDNRIILWVLLSLVVTIGIHSLIDFNLSMGAISIFLWTIFGIARGMTLRINPAPQFSLSSDNVYLKYALVALSALVILISSSLYLGNEHGGRGLTQFNSGNLYLAEESLNKAKKFDPLNSNYQGAFAKIWMEKAGAERNADKLNMALEYANKAIDLDPYNSDKRVIKGNIYLKLGQAKEAVEEYERALEYEPTKQARYVDLADVYLRASKYYAYIEEKDGAVEYANKVLAIPERIAQQAGKMPLNDKMPWVKEEYNLFVSEEVTVLVSEARQLLAELR